MSQDEIIEMARQAGIYHAQDSEYHWDGLTDQKIIERTPDSAKDIAWRNRRTFEILQPFAKLVAEKALAQPEQEPVAWYDKHGMVTHDPFEGVTPLYTTPPQRTWVGLTDDEIALINADYPHPQGFAKAIQAKLKEKNT